MTPEQLKPSLIQPRSLGSQPRILAYARGLIPHISLLLTLTVLWWTVLGSPHLIQSGDLLWPTRPEAVRQMFWPFYSSLLSFPNVETFSRLPWVAPFLLLSSVLWMQKALIFAAVSLSGLGMLAAARRLGAPLALAWIAALIYAYNPWIANRLQHYFLLPGYATLPLILALWLRPLARGNTLAVGGLLTLASATPHYAFFSWALLSLGSLLQPTRAELGRYFKTLLGYLGLNLYWLIPTVLFSARVGLVPSVPTWEGELTFSQNATLDQVWRLGGYWWPLGRLWPQDALWAASGLGLILAACLGAAFARDRTRLFLGLGALVYTLLALGTHIPELMRFLVLEGPLAGKLGWLFRDPNKAVGPLAALLLLLAALELPHLYPARRQVLNWTRGILLALYTLFTLDSARPYLETVYQANPLPAGFAQTNEYLSNAALEGKTGRALWVPQYFGSRTTWNGDNLTPEFPTFSSSVPVQGPYGYNGRSVSSYLILYFGAMLGTLEANLGRVLPLLGTRWLAYHDDLLPFRLQPGRSFNTLSSWLKLGLERQNMPVALQAKPLTLYDAGAPLPAYQPQQVYLSSSPVGALLTLSNWPDALGKRLALVETPHPGLSGVSLQPGEDARVLLAQGSVSIPLGEVTRHYDPLNTWSALDRQSADWWQWNLLSGIAPLSSHLMVLTQREGARLSLPTALPKGPHHLLVRAYQNPRGGAVKLEFGSQSRTLSLSSTGVRVGWQDLGVLNLQGSEPVRLENIYGFNILEEVKLIPQTSWLRAQNEATRLSHQWLWPSSSLCQDHLRFGRPPVPSESLERSGTHLVWQASASGSRRWIDYSAVSFELWGGGPLERVEVWTQVQGTWVFLGSVKTAWRGWKAVSVPLLAENFLSAREGAYNPARVLRVQRVDALGHSSVPQIRSVRLDAEKNCVLPFQSSVKGRASLGLSAPNSIRPFTDPLARGGLDAASSPQRSSGSSQPLSLQVNGQSHTLRPGSEIQVEVKAGFNLLEVPLDRVGQVGALRIKWSTPGSPRSVPNLGKLDCAGRWRLWVSQDLYLAGREGKMGRITLESAAVNGLRQGYWIPPSSCAPLELRNTWVTLGNTCVAASVLCLGLWSLLTLLWRRRV